MIKVRSYEIHENVINNVENMLRTEEKFNCMMVEQLLEQFYVPIYHKINFQFVFREASERIITLWADENLIKRYTNNIKGYWTWKKH